MVAKEAVVYHASRKQDQKRDHSKHRLLVERGMLPRCSVERNKTNQKKGGEYADQNPVKAMKFLDERLHIIDSDSFVSDPRIRESKPGCRKYQTPEESRRVPPCR